MPVLQAKQGVGKEPLSPEATERKRERNRAYMRQRLASRTPEEQEKIDEYQKEYRRTNPEKVSKWNRKANLKIKYGLTVEEHSAILASQDGQCAICWNEPATHTDHDHSTGRVRGLLCSKCNLGLGLFGDDPARLEAASLYLKEE